MRPAEPADPPEPRAHRPVPGRLGPAFHRYWGSDVTVGLTDGMLATAIPLIAALLTTDPLLISGLTAARFLPWLLFGAVAGAVVDRIDRARAMIAANLLRSAALALLAVLLATGHGSIWVLYIAMFTVMTCETVVDTAARAMLPALVDRSDLDRANGRLEGGRVAAEDFAGAPMAGLLFAVAAVLPVASASATYALAALLLVAIPLTARRPNTPARAGGGPADGVPDGGGANSGLPDGGGSGNDGLPEGGLPGDGGAGNGGPAGAGPTATIGQDIAEGFRYVFGVRIMRRLVLLHTGIMFGLQMFSAVLVLFVVERLGVPPALYGVFMASSAVGALVGSAVVARITRRFGRARVLRASLAVMAVLSCALGFAPGPYTGALVWGLMGTALAVMNVLVAGLLQVIVPDELRGRASGVRRMVGWGLSPVGALAGGLLGRVDLALPFAVSGLILGVTVAACWGTMGEAARLAEEPPDPRPAGAVGPAA
ncbi:MFS transporter [Nocardiopsis sediminis]|uniref:MFS transporter n=1 Tax=Nocardiopsis sediminis TaxID=1778267 RepID=A0ABV8FNQ1_9ACTN